MASIRSTVDYALVLTGGRVLPAHGTATADTGQQLEASLLAAGAIQLVDADAPAPQLPPRREVVVVERTGASSEDGDVPVLDFDDDVYRLQDAPTGSGGAAVFTATPYSGGMTVATGDFVTSGGSLFQAKAPATGPAAPPSPAATNSQWLLVVAKGDPGAPGQNGIVDATGYQAGQVPTATGSGGFQPGSFASQQYVDSQVSSLQAQISTLPQQSAIASISYQQTLDKPDDVEDGVPGEMRMVVQLISRQDGTVRRVVAGYFLKLSDGTARGKWDDLVEFPAPPTGSVPLFVGIGDPDPQALPDSLAAYIGQDPQGGGQVSLGDPSGWRDPSARLLAPDAIAGYFGTNHPSVMRQGDFYVDPTYDNGGALTNVQLVFEDGGGPPTDGGPTGPVEPAQVPAPANFAATEKPGFVELAWDQPADTGDDLYTQAWKAEVKPTASADSAYVPVAVTSGTTTVPAGTPAGYMRRVSGVTRYNVRDATTRTAGTALTYRLTAVDANLTHASTPVTDTATVVQAAPQVIATRALTPGSTAVSSLNVSLAQGTNGAASGAHGTVIGNDTRAPAAGDLALLTLDFSNVTSTTRLPTQIVIGGTGGTSGLDVGVASTRATIYTDSESQLNRTDGLYDPPSYPSYTTGTTGWSTGGANQWFVGFYPGLLWRMFDRTGSTVWRDKAIAWQNGFAGQNTFSTHDLGFMFFPTFAEGFRLTGDTTMRSTALTAASTLSARFNSTVGAMQSYDAANGGSQWGFNTIIDSVMNMELLFWAAANGGSSTLYTRALTHLQTVQTNHVRTDGGTWQVVEYNTSTGAVTAKVTNQGFADSSTWARGQAWAIHGFTMAYRYTHTANPTEAATFLATAKKCANYFLDNLPSDGVPRWDFNAPSGDLQKDTSAAAIAAAGLIELAQYDTSRDWLTAGKTLLSAISAPAYRSTSSQGYSLLLHGVSNKPANVGVDVGLIYGDYYYVEGLDRVAALPAGGGGVSGGITFNMIPHDGVTGEFRTDATSGTGTGHYVGVLQTGFPTSIDIPLPASGTSPGALEILDPVTTDAAHTWVLRQTRYNTGHDDVRVDAGRAGDRRG
jgi:unsaturated chondroitin disaccharide hydrolase